KGRTGKALEALTVLGASQPDFKNEIDLLQSRWETNQHKDRIQLQTDEQTRVGQQQINSDILSLLDAIEQGKPARPTERIETVPSGGKPSWKQIFAAIAGTIAVLAGIAELSGYSLRDIFSGADVDDPQEEPADLSQDTIASLPAPSSPETVDPEPRPIEEERRETPSEPSVLPAPLSLSITTDRGDGPIELQSGEDIRLYARVSRPCHLRAIYKLADGQLVLLYDNKEVRADDLGQAVEIGNGFTASDPYGEEELYVFAQSEPFDDLRIRYESGYNFILDGLPEAIRRTRGLRPKADYIQDKLKITTYAPDIQ
ncbi:MAG: hypothetical protein AAFO91_04435, partial [Bacteroidota bacterium]